MPVQKPRSIVSSAASTSNATTATAVTILACYWLDLVSLKLLVSNADGPAVPRINFVQLRAAAAPLRASWSKSFSTALEWPIQLCQAYSYRSLGLASTYATGASHGEEYWPSPFSTNATGLFCFTACLESCDGLTVAVWT